LSLDVHRNLGHLCAVPEAVEGLYRVAGQVDSGALGRRGGGAFDDLDGGTPAAQRASGGQAGDTRADDENSNTGATHRCTSVAVVSATQLTR
jgi:hypothetical protein